MTLTAELDQRVQAPAALRWPVRSRLQGLHDLRATSREAHFTAPVPISGEFVRAELGEVWAESITATAHACARTAELIADQPMKLVALDILTRGVLHRRGPESYYCQEVGQAVLTELDQPFSYQWLHDGHMYRVLLPSSAVRRYPGARRIPAGMLAASPLVPAMTAFLQAALETPHSSREQRLLGRAALEIAQAMISHTVTSTTPVRFSAEEPLHVAVEQHIEAHLTDQNLNPRTIAADLDVSVRAVHAAFNTDGRTVAGTIRDRRLSAIATVLRTRARPPQATELAKQFGFRDTDTLRRAFARTHGMTLKAFNAQYH